jgi:hypothetical protein
MDRTDLDRLPPLVDVPTAASMLGIGRTLANDLVKTDRWPTPVHRMGKLQPRLASGLDQKSGGRTGPKIGGPNTPMEERVAMSTDSASGVCKGPTTHEFLCARTSVPSSKRETTSCHLASHT